MDIQYNYDFTLYNRQFHHQLHLPGNIIKIVAHLYQAKLWRDHKAMNQGKKEEEDMDRNIIKNGAKSWRRNKKFLIVKLDQ